MGNIKVYAHGSYIGETGFNYHTRDFFRSLSSCLDIKVRNFTIGKYWRGYDQTPHEGEEYLEEVDRKILYRQILWDGKGGRSDYPIYSGEDEFDGDLNLILSETDHYISYDSYKGPSIIYNVWESTLQPENFFNRILQYDELWVPSEWQKSCTIKQGFPEEKIRVVPEGIDDKIFFPEELKHPLTSDGRFKFVLFGRWDYRKSTKEIIETFLCTFKKDDPVDLILSVDNPFLDEEFKTTEERISHYGLEDERIKIVHFLPREEYIRILKSSHVFLSCSRSEGWNIPLIEAMASGIPSVYSNCSGQLEFAEGKGIPVKIKGEIPARRSSYLYPQIMTGNHYEPDFEDLSLKMREVYDQYDFYKEKALRESVEIRQKFSWEEISKIGKKTIEDFLERNGKKSNVTENKIEVTYLEGPKVEIIGNQKKNYFVEFIDLRTGEVQHSGYITNNMWIKCSKEYFIPWRIKIDGEILEDLSLKGKTVLISMESKSLGDTIAWSPYIVDFSKKHDCKVVFSSFHNHLFEGLEPYKDIQFINPGESRECFAVYRIGWFKKEGRWDEGGKNPRMPNLSPLQQTATDILGLDFKETNYGINFSPSDSPFKEEYVIFGPASTSGCKEWTREHWASLASLVSGFGYKVVVLSPDQYEIEGTINVFGKSLDQILNYLYHAKAFVGLGSGLSWLNWSLGKHTHMINGFSKEDHEFKSRVTRIFNKGVCISCWNDEVFTFDPGDWNWCPVYKGTKKQYICQKSITPFQVFQSLLDRI